MRGDRENCNLTLVWTVAPEYAIGAGRLVLNISLENRLLRVVGMFQRFVFVGSQAGMSRVLQKLPDAAVNLLEQPFGLGTLLFSLGLARLQRSLGSVFQFLILIRGGLRPDALELHGQSSS
jgi:hypothetical protein